MNAIEYFKKNGLNKSKMHLDIMDAENWHNGFYEDLKRLVESWELIAKFDGIEECKRIVSGAPIGAIGYHTMYEGYFGEKSKHYYEGLNKCLIIDLEKAIADVEKCQ